MGNMISDVRGEELRRYTGDLGQFARNTFQPGLPLARQSVVIFLQVKLQRLDHPNDFFFADLLAPAYRVLMRTVVEQSVRDQIFATDQESRALGPTHDLTTA